MRMMKKTNNPKVNLAIKVIYAIVIIMILIKLGMHLELDLSGTLRF